jgi:4-oxalocrotonate tautomerase
MPFISVQLGAKPDPKLTRSVVRTVTELTAKLLHKDPAVTSVAVQYIDRAEWFIGFESLQEHGANSFFVDTRISDGTNTKAEKAAYIRGVFDALSELLGSVHPESYVHADDVRADGYGFGGVTQEQRLNAPRTVEVAA